jgi:drug/metabolite transporter (DMT)-like permease
VALVVPLSLLAALLFALAAALQQQSAHEFASADQAATVNGQGRPRPPAVVLLPVLGLLDRLVRDRRWLLGWVINLCGFMCQAVALHLGSIAVVQPLLVTQLLFALPLSTMRKHCRMLPRDWLGGGAICAGLAVLLSVRGAAPTTAEPERSSVLLATAAAAVLIVLFVLAGHRVSARPQLRATLIAVAAGICFCMSAVFITLTADNLVHRGVPETATDWPGYALAASTVLGLILEQDAFAAGSLPTAVAAMTITNPVASYLAGVLAFNAMPPETPGALAGVASAGLLISVGVFILAHSPTVQSGGVAVAPEPARPPRARSAKRPQPARGEAGSA